MNAPRNTESPIALLWTLIALALSGTAFGQGNVPQILEWLGATNDILALNVAYPLSATASSGLPVTLCVQSGPAWITNGSITVTNFGTVVVRSEQAGDAIYARMQASRSFNVRNAFFPTIGAYGACDPRDAQVVGRYAYVVGEKAGLMVIDVSKPANPIRAGAVQVAGYPNKVRVSEGYAYVIDPRGILFVFSLNDPANPVQVGVLHSWDDRNRISDLQVVGHYAYLPHGEMGLEIVDVSDPRNPVLVGRADIFSHARYASAVQVVGKHAYVAGEARNRLIVIDVSSPISPAVVSGIDTEGTISGFQLFGKHAYVATVNKVLQVIDVGDPANPVEVSRHKLAGPALSVNVVEGYAYVATVDAGLVVIDVSNPDTPMSVGAVDTSRNTFDGLGWMSGRVAVDGNYLYLPNVQTGLKIVGKTFLYPQSFKWHGNTNPILAQNVPMPLSATANSGLPVALRVEAGPASFEDGKITVFGTGTVVVSAEQAGNEAFGALRETRSINVRKVVLKRLGRCDLKGVARSIQVSGDYAFVAACEEGLQVVDVRDPRNPRVQTNVPPLFACSNVQVVGSYAYVGGGGSMTLVDVRNPLAPTVVGNVLGPTSQVRVAGRWAYVAGMYSLLTINVNNPSNPISIGDVVMPNDPHGLFVAGARAYVVGPSYLQAVDIGNPSKPLRIGKYDDPILSAYGLWVDGHYAYVAARRSGLQVIDVSDPMKMVKVGVANKNDLDFDAYDVQVIDNYAYVASGHAGVQVVDLGNPAAPMIVGGHATDEFTAGVHVVGTYAYAATSFDGVQIFEINFVSPQALQLQMPEEIPFGSRQAVVGTATSGLPITFTVKGGPASIVNGHLVMTGLGPVTIHGEQSGSDSYLPSIAEWVTTVIPPKLGAALSQDQVELFWPAGIGGLQLQSSETPSPEGTWQVVPVTTTEAGGEIHARLEVDANHRFLRLVKP